jgi:hypothetical protein
MSKWRRFLACLCLALSGGPLRAASPAEEAVLAEAAGALEQAWKGDPVTAALGWPAIRLLPEGATIARVCPGVSPAASDATALYCPAQSAVLVDRRWFTAEVERYGVWGAAYWVATALGEAIRLAHPAAGSAGLPPAAATLQANCLAGVLLGASSGLPALPPNRRLAPAQTAYPAAAAGRSGSRAQRAYALLTGLGATDATCSGEAMVQLAAGQVPDPALLEELQADPRSRAVSSFATALNAQCRKPLRCPRRIGDVFVAPRRSRTP